jgi:glycogen phosphorylase
MTSTIDPTKIGKPPSRRRHVRTLTGMYFPLSSSFELLIIVQQDIFLRKTRRGKTNGQGAKRRSGEMVCVLSIRVSLRHLFFCLLSRSQHYENYENTDVDQVTKSVVNHVQTSLARQCYNLGMTLFF